MRSILVVEDHSDTRSVLVNLLSRWGHEVHGTGTAAEGLLAVENIRFDVIVSDIGLPDESGWELMRKVRALDEQICGIALTAYATPEDRDQSARAGFDFHFTKPADMAQLRAAISE
jgi:CheY-like chemotaxis protein